MAGLGLTIIPQVEALVQDKFTQSMGYADNAFSSAISLIDTLGSTSVTVPYSNISVSIHPVDSSFTDATNPGTVTVIPNTATMPDAVNLVSPEITDVDIPSNDVISPSVNIPDAPEMVEFTVPEVPSTETVTAPSAYTVVDPTAPKLIDIVFPTPVTLVIPEFVEGEDPKFDQTLVIPDFDASQIISTLSTVNSFFVSELTKARDKLLDLITDPKMVISTEVQQQITDQMMQKIADEYGARYDEANTYFSSRGWNLPQGVMIAKLSEIDRLRAVSEDNVQRDVAIKNFELSNQSALAALQMWPQYTNVIVSSSLTILDQVIKVSEFTFTSALQKYSAAFEVYKAQVDMYKLKIEIYRTKVEVQKILVDMYNTQVNAVKITVDANKAAIDMFRVYVEIEQTKMEVYKLEVQTMLAQIEQNKGTIDLYKAEIEGYSAGLSSNAARVQLFQGQVAGQESLVKLYNAQVQAYAASLEGVKATASIHIENAKAKSELNQAEAAVYTAKIHGFTAQLQEAMSNNEIAAKIFLGNVGVFEAQSRTNAAKAEVRIKESETNARVAEVTAELSLKQAEVNMHNALTQAQLQMEAIKGAASVSAQLAASALSAVSAGASLHAQASVQDSSSTTY